MKFKASGISSFNAALFVALFIIMAAVIGLAIVWGLLHIWNWFAISAGFDAQIPINFATVAGAWVIWMVLKSLFSRGKS